MFARYTDRANRALDIAQDEARNLGHARVGAGHLLLGLIGEDGGVAAVALKSLGADLGEARHVMSSTVSEVRAPAGPLPFTSRAEGVLRRAADEAAQLGHPYIATEHLLLALITDSEGSGNDPLVAIGINPGDARAKVLEMLRGYEQAGQQPIPDHVRGHWPQPDYEPWDDVTRSDYEGAPDAPDRLAAVLEEIGERNERRTFAANLTHAASADDVPRLLAALKKVLKKADEWDAEAKRLDENAENADATSGHDTTRVARAAMLSTRAQAHAELAAAVREAITSELTGEAT